MTRNTAGQPPIGAMLLRWILVAALVGAAIAWGASQFGS
jgi:hypothetical protein